MKTKQAQLGALNKEWTIKCPCGLSDNATQAVPGEGSADAKILFIGEAPGKNEDEQGRPFVGAAGKFFDQMLESIGLAREDVYITNIVKFRPPNNRDPLPHEIEASLPWLEGQINIIRPKLIVFLGRHSLNHFFPDEQISKAHGKLLERKFQNIPVEYFLPLYHPAAALHNGSLREVLKEDFKKIPRVLKTIEKK